MVPTARERSRRLASLSSIYLARDLRAYVLLLGLVLATFLSANTRAQEPPGVTPAELAQVFPRADRAGAMQGEPQAAPAFTGERLVGYVLSTAATVGSVGYSGKPLDILMGFDLEARVTGALLRRHNEPILVIGVDDETLKRYVTGFTGIDLRLRPTAVPETGGPKFPDAIAGATVSSGVIRDTILRAGRAVARSRGLLGGAPEAAKLDRESFSPATWEDLLADGSIVARRITVGEVAEANGAPMPPGQGSSDAVFVELFIGLATPPRIGQNLLGKRVYDRLTSEIGIDDQLVFVAASGRYSFKGTAWVRSGRFERVQVVQDQTTIPLTANGYYNVEQLAIEGSPELREIGVFILPAQSGFDPMRAWRLDLLVDSGGTIPPVIFAIDYRLPDRYVLSSAVQAAGEAVTEDALLEDVPFWQQAWRDRKWTIGGVLLLLGALTTILVFQDRFAGNKRLHRRVRLAFLAITLVWLGWVVGGQLSVVNVLTFVHALISEFRWEFFLVDPVLFLLWSYVAVALLFWGRGVFCGWLCPFGALQELLSEGARQLRIPQLRLPFVLHEKLWPLKYIIFLGLFAVSLNSVNLAFVGAEVEPFKTAISMKFIRHWPFVVYAGALLAAGLFVERFFCRYLCPLGAALAIPARIRMFEWLKRHPQCGRECAICEHSCPVQAIHPSGEINPNECIYCLKCQTLYYDEFVCPPLVHRRKRRERRAELAAGQPVSVPER
jgi:transcriptional regulator of nitric oxide reductase/ferredoxin